jgi:hypothetical protein
MHLNGIAAVYQSKTTAASRCICPMHFNNMLPSCYVGHGRLSGSCTCPVHFNCIATWGENFKTARAEVALAQCTSTALLPRRLATATSFFIRCTCPVHFNCIATCDAACFRCGWSCCTCPVHFNCIATWGGNASNSLTALHLLDALKLRCAPWERFRYSCIYPMHSEFIAALSAPKKFAPWCSCICSMHFDFCARIQTPFQYIGF